MSKSSLPRVLGLWMAIAIVIGTVIGSGVFKKPAAVAKDIPEVGMALAAWVLVGTLAVIGSLILAEVAVVWPKAGGNYAFLREGYGRWAGFLWGWVEFWIIRSGSIAALASVFTDSFHDILRQLRQLDANQEVLDIWARSGMTASVITVLALVNARGTRWGGGLQLLVTTVKVGSLLGIALLPFLMMAIFAEPMIRPAVREAAVLWPTSFAGIDWSKFGAAMVGILWAYHGWMNLAPVVEEVREPDRNIPRAFIIGTLAVIALYVSVNVAYYMVLPSADMVALKDRPVASEFAFRLLGPIGVTLASAAIMLSVFGSLNGNLLVGPRLLYAMGNDGLAPRFLSRLHSVYQTPVAATLVLAGWAIGLVVGGTLLVEFRLPILNIGTWALDLNLPPNKPLFDLLTDYAMFGAVSFETLAVATIFVVRHRYPVGAVDVPYRCRLYPLLPIVYVAIMALVLFNMFVTQRTESIVAVGFILIGAAIYSLLRFCSGNKSNLPLSENVREW